MINEEHLEISIDDVFKAIFSEEWSEEESPEYGTIAYDLIITKNIIITFLKYRIIKYIFHIPFNFH